MIFSIKKRLIFSFLLVALLVGLLGFFGYANLKDTADQVDVITERETPVLAKLSTIKSRALKNLEETLSLAKSEELMENVELIERLDDLGKIDSTGGEIGEGGEIELLEEIVKVRMTMLLSTQTLIETYQQDGEISQSSLAGIEAEIDDLIRLIAVFVEIESQEVVAAQRDIQANLLSARRITIIVVSVAIALAIGLGLLLSRSILGPIYRLRDVAEELGKGNLGVRAMVESKDEIGSLADSFNQMAAARQQVEEQRGALIAELEDKNEKLEVAYGELQTLDKMKDEFISNVSHEFRTPLTSIKGAAELLLDNGDADPKTRLEFLRIIDSQSDRLTRLISDVLDLSLMESGATEWRISPVDLSAAIETAVNGTHALAVNKNLTVKTGFSNGLPAVDSDPDKLVQVITNLLSNAIKFTPAGGLIHVKSRLAPTAHPVTGIRMAEVSVSDNGVGIAATEFEMIFERFQRSDSSDSSDTDRPGGTGLGLAICKEIVVHLGGDIWVESKFGEGSTFSFTVPVAEAPN